jgi:DNA-directed RNA polymerase specialized sigma24 family protein
MRTSVNSIKQRLFRARRELRRQLMGSRPAAGERTG